MDVDPVLEMRVYPPMLVPYSNHAGVRPANATSFRAEAKRRTSPISARSKQAVRVPMPGIVGMSTSSFP